MLGKDGLTINKNDFKLGQKDNSAYRSFIIVRNDALQYPVFVYRFSDEQYSALWMKCTHQGTELNASGEFLQCPAHGSEFNSNGKVRSGPADKDLRTFPVVVSSNELFIDLRKQS
jgi:Rieske Fe-S protein